jgi:hypothetical protein
MRRAVAIAAGFLVVCVGLFAVRFHEVRLFSGDEPHYLIVTESLINDGDVDVKNDYALARYRALPDPPDVHVNPNIFTASSPHWYSSHGVGLPAIIVPGTAIDNARGAAAEMVLVATVVLVLTFFWARRFTATRYAAVATAVVGYSPFFLGLDGRIFPDLPTAALLLGCLLLLELRQPHLWQFALLSVLVASLRGSTSRTAWCSRPWLRSQWWRPLAGRGGLRDWCSWPPSLDLRSCRQSCTSSRFAPGSAAGIPP